MAEQISNEQIYEMIREVRDQVKALNGCVRQNTTDIAVLKSRDESHSVNWDRVIQFGLAVLQAIILWRLLAPAP